MWGNGSRMWRGSGGWDVSRDEVCVRVFNTGDDGGGKLLEATVPQQVWMNRSSPRDGQSCRKRDLHRCILS